MLGYACSGLCKKTVCLLFEVEEIRKRFSLAFHWKRRKKEKENTPQRWHELGWQDRGFAGFAFA